MMRVVECLNSSLPCVSTGRADAKSGYVSDVSVQYLHFFLVH